MAYIMLLLCKSNNMITTYYLNIIFTNYEIDHQTYSKHLEGEHLYSIPICLIQYT